MLSKKGDFMKVTMQDIADALNISRISVWKVFNNQEGVSEMLKEKVYNKASELGYTKVPHHQTAILSKPTQEITVAVVVSRPDSSLFWSNIIHRMAQELCSLNINLLYVYVPSIYKEGYVLPETLKNPNLKGIVVLNIYDTTILNLLNTLELEKVFLDVTTDFNYLALQGSLILIEGKDTVETLVTRLIEDKGYKKIGFLGDIRYALTNRQRYEGYISAMRHHQMILEDDYLFSNEIEITDYEATIDCYLDKVQNYPEVYVCVSDFLANFVYQYFLKNPKKLNHPLLVTGYDGTNEYANVKNEITTAYIDTFKIGKLLAREILNRIENPKGLKSVTFLYPEIKYIYHPIMPQK